MANNKSANTRLLNWADIKSKRILNSTSDGHFNAASYDLSVGVIYPIGKDTPLTEVAIPPQGMALIISREAFTLPENVIAYTTVKNRVSNQGLLALNIGIVDPGYKGPISSIVINFGRLEKTVRSGDAFLRMTFHEFEPSKRKPPSRDRSAQAKYHYSRNQYISDRLAEANSHLGPTFLSLEKTEMTIMNSVWAQLWDKGGKLSFLFALLLGSLTLFLRECNASDEIKKADLESLKRELKTELRAEINRENVP